MLAFMSVDGWQEHTLDHRAICRFCRVVAAVWAGCHDVLVAGIIVLAQS